MVKRYDMFVFTFSLLSRTIRAISSDRGKVVSGSDDQTVLVWDKQTTQLLEELKGHDAQVLLKLCLLASILSSLFNFALEPNTLYFFGRILYHKLP